MDRPSKAGRVNVYVVIVALARSDGSRAHDAKWVIASSAEQAGERALESAALRWPNRAPLEVVSARIDHSRRAERFLARSREAPKPPPRQPAETIETQPVRARVPELRRPVEVPHADSRETAPATRAPSTVAADTLTDRVRGTFRSLRARAPRRD